MAPRSCLILAIGVFLFLVVCAGSIGGGAWYMIDRLSTLNEEMVRVVVPGSQEVSLDNAGVYTIFHEYRSTVDGRVFNSGQGVHGLQCTLTPVSGGNAITLEPLATNVTYSIGAYAGIGLYTFEIDAPGTYQFEAGYADGEGNDAVLAFGYGATGAVMGSIMALFAGIGGGLVVGGIVLVVTIFMVIRSQQAHRTAEGAGQP